MKKQTHKTTDGTRTYKGYRIYDWSGPYNMNPDCREPNYYIQTQHHSGINWSPEHCPQVFSLREARDTINSMISSIE